MLKQVATGSAGSWVPWVAADDDGTWLAAFFVDHVQVWVHAIYIYKLWLINSTFVSLSYFHFRPNEIQQSYGFWIFPWNKLGCTYRALQKNSHPMKYHTIEAMSPPSPNSMLSSEFCARRPSKKQPFLLIMLGTSDHNIEVGGCGGKQTISVVSSGWLFLFKTR